MKKTKIICSIGPASCEISVMEKMVDAGMNVARINFSHATTEEKEKVVKTVKEVRKKTGAPIAILYDTKGPEFRSGMMEKNEIILEEGKTIRIIKTEVLGNTERFSVNHPSAIDNLTVGDTVLLENGLMKMMVISKEEDGVTCTIINGGILGNKKSLSVPGKHLNIPFISKIDKEDMIYACTHDADFIALSFVNTKEDVEAAKEIFASAGREDVMVISKIESKTGIDNLEAILEISDGVMVARGDLGVEVPLEELPIYQKLIVKKSRQMGKICIIATEMLETMKQNARPTRAEVSDIANAVLDGTDAIMLSGETTTGLHPIEAVSYMANVCKSTEAHLDYDNQVYPISHLSVTSTICHSVVVAANSLNVKAILASSLSGYTVAKLSNLRPKATIFATCTSEKTSLRLALSFGVYSVVVPTFNSTDEIIENAIKEARKKINLNPGDKVVITGGFPQTKSTNFMKIEEIEA